jgi:hypothetical protein
LLEVPQPTKGLTTKLQAEILSEADVESTVETPRVEEERAPIRIEPREPRPQQPAAAPPEGAPGSEPLAPREVLFSREQDEGTHESTELEGASLLSIVRQMVVQPTVVKPVRQEEARMGTGRSRHRGQPDPSSNGRAPKLMPVTTSEAQPAPEEKKGTSPRLTVLEPRVESVPAFSEARQAETTTVKVTIGRLEIRATPATPAAPDKPRPRPALMSLEDYLSEREAADPSSRALGARRA